jgi:hypothetical protein
MGKVRRKDSNLITQEKLPNAKIMYMRGRNEGYIKQSENN